MHDSVDSPPLVRIFRLATNHTEALQNVDNVIDAASFNIQLFGAGVKHEKPLAFLTVDAQELAAELSQTLFLSSVLPIDEVHSGN